MIYSRLTKAYKKAVIASIIALISTLVALVITNELIILGLTALATFNLIYCYKHYKIYKKLARYEVKNNV